MVASYGSPPVTTSICAAATLLHPDVRQSFIQELLILCAECGRALLPHPLQLKEALCGDDVLRQIRAGMENSISLSATFIWNAPSEAVGAGWGGLRQWRGDSYSLS